MINLIFRSGHLSETFDVLDKRKEGDSYGCAHNFFRKEEEGTHGILSTLSVERLKNGKRTEDEEIQNRSGYLWECIGRRPDQFGGFLYEFKLRKEFDDVTVEEDLKKHKEAIDRINKDYFPAVELSAAELSYLNSAIDMEKGIDELTQLKIDKIAQLIFVTISPSASEERIRKQTNEWHREKIRRATAKDYKMFSEVKVLGYKMESKQGGFYLSLPDQEALKCRWEKIRRERKELPELDIVSIGEHTDGLEVVEAYLKHHGHLSNGNEFVHDSLVHLIPTLAEILVSGKNGEPTYREKK